MVILSDNMEIVVLRAIVIAATSNISSIVLFEERRNSTREPNLAFILTHFLYVLRHCDCSSF